jgi:(E)-4-hydroxy-3-methylbut-2-enyl-diphosphate synthase
LFHIVDEVERATINHVAPIKIAIMGCVVNGPGEAKEADIGIAGGDGRGVLFKRGEVVKTFAQDKLVDVLLTEIAAYEKRYIEKAESWKDQNGKKGKNSHITHTR